MRLDRPILLAFLVSVIVNSACLPDRLDGKRPSRDVPSRPGPARPTLPTTPPRPPVYEWERLAIWPELERRGARFLYASDEPYTIEELKSGSFHDFVMANRVGCRQVWRMALTTALRGDRLSYNIVDIAGIYLADTGDVTDLALISSAIANKSLSTTVRIELLTAEARILRADTAAVTNRYLATGLDEYMVDSLTDYWLTKPPSAERRSVAASLSSLTQAGRLSKKGSMSNFADRIHALEK